MENKHAFWKKVKTKEGRGVSIGIETKDGTVLMEKNEAKDRWREYFSELLGGEETVSSMVEEDLEGVMERVSNGMLEEEITGEEIRKSVGKLKKGKARGVCEISGELLKAGGEVYSDKMDDCDLQSGLENRGCTNGLAKSNHCASP